jgi:hypothetical protein
MTGYPDGTFQPGRPLTYAEALTVLERTLGIAPTQGTWPGNVLAVAAQARLVRSEVKEAVIADAAALRGVIFVLVADALQRPGANGTTLLDEIAGSGGPSLTAALSVSGVDTTLDRVTVTGTVRGALLVSVAGRPVPVVQGMFTAEVPLTLGHNTILVLATDMNNRQASQRLTITRLLPDSAGGSGAP